MNRHRHEVSLRPAQDGESSDLLRDLLDTVEKLIPASPGVATVWQDVKPGQVSGDIINIRTLLREKILKLKSERERLVLERDRAIRAAEKARAAESNRHEERIFQLKTERLTAKAEAHERIVAAIARLRELNVPIEILLREAALLESKETT